MTRSTRKRRFDADRMFPILGVVALAVIAVTLYVAFTASSGLPGEKRYEIAVQVPDANRIIKNADVRIGGTTVGRVADTTAVAPGGGRPPYARLKVSLEAAAGPLAIDTRAAVRPASVLGLTYLELRPGKSSKTVPQQGTLSVKQAATTVDLTDLFNVFDRSTADNFQEGMSHLGAGFAGRGGALNVTIGSTSRLMTPLRNVASTLADPDTQLGPLIANYDSTVGALGPVKSQLGQSIANGATTLDAFARERKALGDTIDAAAPAEGATTEAFTRARPALRGLAQLSEDLLPGVRKLPGALQDVNTALPAGQRPLHELPAFSGHLRTTLATLRSVVRDPATRGTVRKLPDLFEATDSLVAPIAEAELRCNLVPLWAQNFGGYLKAYGSGAGPAINNIILTHPGAEGESVQNAQPAANVGINYLPHQNASECESNNEPYDGKQSLVNPPGLQTDDVPDTAPPADARARAQAAGLLDDPEGAP